MLNCKEKHYQNIKERLNLILTAFLNFVTSRPVGWIAHNSVGKPAHGPERWVLQKEIRVGGGCPGMGEKLL
jgi:hypothetical protein